VCDSSSAFLPLPMQRNESLHIANKLDSFPLIQPGQGEEAARSGPSKPFPGPAHGENLLGGLYWRSSKSGSVILITPKMKNHINPKTRK
jgi:hypothetical protein